MASLLGGARVGSSYFGSTISRCPAVVSTRRVAPVPLQIVAGWGRAPKIGGGRRWKHPELTKNGKPVRHKIHVKTGDTVQVIAGKDKGVVAQVEKVLPTEGKVVVKGVNIKVKNIPKKSENEAGSQVRKEFPIASSNVMHYSTTANVRSRVGKKVSEDGKKVRYLIKTGEVLN